MVVGHRACVEDFAKALQLKSPLSLARYVHTDDHEGLFECGAPANKPAKHMVHGAVKNSSGATREGSKVEETRQGCSVPRRGPTPSRDEYGSV
jgi:hypothetical protein